MAEASHNIIEILIICTAIGSLYEGVLRTFKRVVLTSDNSKVARTLHLENWEETTFTFYIDKGCKGMFYRCALSSNNALDTHYRL